MAKTKDGFRRRTEAREEHQGDPEQCVQDRNPHNAPIQDARCTVVERQDAQPRRCGLEQQPREQREQAHAHDRREAHEHDEAACLVALPHREEQGGRPRNESRKLGKPDAGAKHEAHRAGPEAFGRPLLEPAAYRARGETERKLRRGACPEHHQEPTRDDPEPRPVVRLGNPVGNLSHHLRETARRRRHGRGPLAYPRELAAHRLRDCRHLVGFLCRRRRSRTVELLDEERAHFGVVQP